MLVRPLPAARFLLLDTCGSAASIALAADDEILRETVLEERTASTALLGGVRFLLRDSGLSVADLAGIGVVNGPGSFTGVRLGLAMAKGMCEAAGVPLATVSRLAVLADTAGSSEGFAVLSAGRGQAYVREGEREWLMSLDSLVDMADGALVAYAEPELAEALRSAPKTRFLELSAGSSLRLVREKLRSGRSDLAQADANYVRNEQEIYARQRSAS